MSKAQMIVLGFLNHTPMHGYQIGLIVEQGEFPVWAGIKLPSVYKAMQSLEKSRHIRGEETREGNNPPRTVYHINLKGKILLTQMLNDYLADSRLSDRDWWLALSFSHQCIGKEALVAYIDTRVIKLRDKDRERRQSKCLEETASGRIPFVHKHLIGLARSIQRAEIKALKELRLDILQNEHPEFFQSQGEHK
ncbi:MAG: PadR family transcriptional regulator [Candidatus Cloacimonadaceae bacterium]|nr:PadR family transcriptional regulator [Candidatus Cloacimonadaceae bacterium]